VTYFRNENQNGSLNEELSIKWELKHCVFGEFYTLISAPRNRKKGVLVNFGPLKAFPESALIKY